MHKTCKDVWDILKEVKDQSLLWCDHEKHCLLGYILRLSVCLRLKTNLLGDMEGTRCLSCVLRGSQRSNSDIMCYEELAYIWWRQRRLEIFKAKTWEVGNLGGNHEMKSEESQEKWVSLRRKKEMRISLENAAIQYSFFSSYVWLASHARRLHRVIRECVCVFCVFVCIEWIWPTFEWACIINHSMLHLCQLSLISE